MRIRGYTVNTANFETYFSGYRVLYDENFIPFKEKMNDTYLKICIANLYEKYLCGGISDAEWQKIYDSNIFIIESINL